MITVEEAKRIVFNQQVNCKTESISFYKSVGRMLAQNIVADRAMPPFNRVTMDGIAINYLDFEQGINTWTVVKTQYAGEAATSISGKGECVEVMTGAVLPEGCDTVIRYEDLEEHAHENNEKQFALINIAIKKGQNIHVTGSDKMLGEVVLKTGHLIGATDIALLATVGILEVLVYRNLNIAIIATGDELTSMEEIPDSFQIRASNHEMIAAALKEEGYESDKFLMRDDLSQLQNLLEKCLQQYDVIVLTGAVSKGKADFIPSILSNLKVEKLFHGVSQRPGKPFWFGKKDQCLVFAMPGNPVSAALCTYVYLLPFLKKNKHIKLIKYKAKVEHEINFKPELTYFMQAKVTQAADCSFIAKPIPGNGSGDLTNLSEINAFIALPADETQFNSNAFYEVYFTRSIIY